MFKDLSAAFKKRAPRIAKTIQAKANEYGKIGLQTIDLQVLRGQLSKRYQVLGEAYYKAAKEAKTTMKGTSRDVFKPLLAELAEGIAEIDSLHKKVSELQSQIRSSRPKASSSPKRPERKRSSSKGTKKRSSSLRQTPKKSITAKKRTPKQNRKSPRPDA